MELYSLSASSLQTWQLCPSRWVAENYHRSRGYSGRAASLGTAVHGALEPYVQFVYIDRKEEPSLKLLLDFFKMSYITTFGTAEVTTVEYMEGRKMLETWFGRHDLDEIHRVVSCEQKTFFEVPTSLGPKPYNYIWDRFDEKEPGVYRVVDYKTNKWNVTVGDLKKKIQARSYALAAAIQLKAQGIEYEKIWVEFDMLRHERVGVVFTREENIQTWNYIHDEAASIIATDPDAVEERLNDACLFCVRKASCDALKKNIIVGGIHSISTIEEAIDTRAEVEWQMKGLGSLMKDLDAKILTEAKERDIAEWEASQANLQVSVSRTRDVDAEMVEMAIGSKLFDKYGSKGITLATIDRLLKGKELTPEQKQNLRSLIYYKTGEPKVKIIPKNPLDD